MTLELVGAGLGRTGTHSLKLALEQLLGAPCYHMFEVLQHPDHIPVWQQAVDGGSSRADWDALCLGLPQRRRLAGGRILAGAG
jgi:hypothetical protein